MARHETKGSSDRPKAKPRTRTGSGLQNASTLHCEPLEERSLLAIASISLGGSGILNISGDATNDNVKVAVVGTTIVVTDNSGPAQAKPSWNFEKAAVSRVSFWGSAGNDKLDASACTVPVMGDGGSGNDTLFGGSANDTLLGGTGNDRINGNAGNDFMYGNDGNDKLYANAGNDSIYGGAGDDYLDGAEGSNFLDGQSGFDFRGDIWAPGGATAADVQQRYSDTCVFLASLGAAWYSGIDLSARITSLGDSNFRVKLFINNLWTDVPVFFDGTIQSQSDPAPLVENESWVVLFQRAFLSRVTSFQNERAALSTVTGKLTSTIVSKSGNPVDDDFDVLTQAVAAKKAITTGSSLVKSEITDARIKDSHMYTLVSTSIVNGQKFVRVRNPWGIADPNSNNGELDVTWANFKNSFTVYHYV